MKNREDIFRLRTAFTFIFLALIFIAIFVRLIFVQVVDRPRYLSELLPQFDYGYDILNAERGEIFDRNGVVAAYDIVSYQLDLNPSLMSEEEHERLLENLPGILNIKKEKVEQILKVDHYLMVDSSISEDQKLKIEEIGIRNGITLTKKSERVYPFGEVLAPVIGFTGTEGDGLAGIEFSFNSELEGKKGRVFYNISSTKPLTPGKPSYEVEAEKGGSVTLTLDSNIQYEVQKMLINTIKKTEAKAGVVIVVDVKTGEILAMVNYPSFDPYSPTTSFTSLNRAVYWNYEPGSILKPIVAAAALSEGTLNSSDEFYCPGTIKVGDTIISCWQTHGKEKGLNEIMKDSCDVSFVRIGLNLGREKMLDNFKRFGFGRGTGIELPGEESGIVPSPSSIGDVEVATMSFGQGIAVTPLQLATALCAIGNDGIEMKPSIIKEVKDSDGQVVYSFKPVIKQAVISEKVAETVLESMRAVVSKDGVYQAIIDGYSIAGKTGTAQKLQPGKGYSKDKLIYSFFGLVPGNDPEVGVLVVVDETLNPTYSLNITAPLFREIALYLIKYLRIQP